VPATGPDEPSSTGSALPAGRRIVVLTAQGTLSRIIVNGLAKRVGPIIVIAEQPEARGEVFRRRARLLGVATAIGQVALGFAMRLDRRRGRKLREIYAKRGLNPDFDPDIPVHAVPSINAQVCRDLLAALEPDVVAVYGTRLLSRQTLAAVPAPFINYHAGITPKYRGQDPGYWALAAGDAEHAGVTIHLVDHGVDTGAVLYHERVVFGSEDTLGTYQHVQAATALPLFARAIEDALAGRLAPAPVNLPSMQWFPPTIWTYVRIGLTRGVW
jgi:hypothetical protein